MRRTYRSGDAHSQWRQIRQRDDLYILMYQVCPRNDRESPFYKLQAYVVW